jgi:UDP-N-acetyl-D-galactosamine dehydrogenase
LKAWDDMPCAEAVISAVAHRELLARPLTDYRDKVVDAGCFIDIKSHFDPQALRDSGLTVWRL